MARSVYESPYSFVSLDRASQSLGRTVGTLDADDDKTADAINWALGEMDGYTNRNLAGRTYRSTTDLAGTLSSTRTFTVASGASALKALDDVLYVSGTGRIYAGTRIASITGDTVITLSKDLNTTGTCTLRFGSAPMIVTGNGTHDTASLERPLNAVYAAYYIDTFGTRTAIDLTYMEFDPDTGRIRLRDQVWPKGFRIELELSAGYLQPTTTQLGHWADWNALARVQLRLAQIFDKDDTKLRGRSTESRAGQSSTGFIDYEMPKDVKATLDAYARVW